MEKVVENTMQGIAAKQLEVTKKVYLLSPSRMFAEYQGETENVKNYNNRQLLEMLQNADDAASQALGPKVALIKLMGKKLIIANTGYGFSEEGLNSIFHSHLSPKEAMDGQIGKKGLGFRSILSWAKKVTIKSHDLCVAFSKEFSKNILAELLKDSDFRKEFDKLKKKDEFPISTLVCPEVEGASVLYFEGIEEFDTIIEIDLLDHAADQVKQQLDKDVDSEVLLFLNNLTQINIDIDGLRLSYQKNRISDNELEILSRSGEVVHQNRWNIYSLEGRFEEISRDYCLSVAWQNDFAHTKDVIYSYFRTKVPVYCKGIIHGSFELNADRNLIIDDGEGYNRKLADLIPDLMAGTSEKIVQLKDDEFNYKGLAFLQTDFQSLNHLTDHSILQQNILKSAKDKEIFPVIGHKYVMWNEKDSPVFYEEELFSKYLDPADFPDLLIYADEAFILKCLKELNYSTYNINGIIESIGDMRSEISISDYAALIKSIYNHLPEDDGLLKTKGLFYDNEMNLLTFGLPLFLPNSGLKYTLPSELGIQILGHDLAEELLKTYGFTDFKKLAEALSRYGLKEFNFSEVAEALISHYSKHEALAEDEIKKLHKTLFGLYFSDSGKDSKWSGKAVPVLNRKNKIAKANKLYFGRDYGNVLAEEIYHYDKSKLLASPKKNGAEGFDSGQWKKYMEWLGVASKPRKIRVDVKDDYADYVMRNFNYSNAVDDYTFKKGYKQFKSRLTGGYGRVSVITIDDFDSILQNNTSESIINLIDKDSELFNYMEKNIEPEASRIFLDFYNTRNYRTIGGTLMKSYLKWKLGHSEWLQTEAGFRAEPSKCSSAAYVNEDFSGLIEKPKIDFDALIAKKIQRDKTDYILSLAGVHKTISTLSPDMIFNILGKLPEIDPLGKKAKTIYNQIAANYDEKILLRSTAFETEYRYYLHSGKVFCKDGIYHPINTVHYVNDKRYGETVVKQFNTIEIDKRRGKDKIRKIFGVVPLDNIELNIAGMPLLHPLNSKFELEIENFKPYVYVLRKEQDSGDEKNIIKNTRIQLVSNLTASLSVSDEIKTFELDDFEYLYLKKRNLIFIKIPADYTEINSLKEDIFFCSSISEVFSAILDVDSQRLQIRELFSKSNTVRDELLRSEMDDDKLEKLNDARKKLGVISNPKIDFWKAFVKCFKGKKLAVKNDTEKELLEALVKLFPENRDIIELSAATINYNEINEEMSSELVVSLFKSAGVTISDFNKYYYPSIDISMLYEISFKKALDNNLEMFKTLQYYKCKSNISSKGRLLEFIDEYQSLSSVCDNEVDFDVQKDLEETVGKTFEINLNQHPSDKPKAVDLNALYSRNSELIWEMVKTEEIDRKLFNQFMGEGSYVQSLSIFEEEFDKVSAIFNQWLGKNKPLQNGSEGGPSKSNRILFNKEALFYDDLIDLKAQVDNLISEQEIKKMSFENVKIAKSDKTKSGATGGRPQSGRGLSHKKQKEEIGFLGEYLVYKHLIGISENESDVKWVSGYAKSCGVNLDGKDGHGYDIQYIPKGAKYPRYVEVKVVDWQEAFHITSTEVRAGEELKKNYEVFLVRNIGNISEIKIERIQGLFDYKGQSFTDNDLFTVVNDNFILKFKKAQP